MKVHRKRGESFEAFLRRFNKVLLHSGRLIEARKVRFFQKSKSRIQKRESALRRKGVVERQEYLARVGKLPQIKVQKPFRRF